MGISRTIRLTLYLWFAPTNFRGFLTPKLAPKDNKSFQVIKFSTCFSSLSLVLSSNTAREVMIYVRDKKYNCIVYISIGLVGAVVVIDVLIYDVNF